MSSAKCCKHAAVQLEDRKAKIRNIAHLYEIGLSLHSSLPDTFFTYSIVLVSITFLQYKLMSLGMILLGFALTPDEEDIAMFWNPTSDVRISSTAEY